MRQGWLCGLQSGGRREVCGRGGTERQLACALQYGATAGNAGRGAGTRASWCAGGRVQNGTARAVAGHARRGAAGKAVKERRQPAATGCRAPCLQRPPPPLAGCNTASRLCPALLPRRGGCRPGGRGPWRNACALAGGQLGPAPACSAQRSAPWASSSAASARRARKRAIPTGAPSVWERKGVGCQCKQRRGGNQDAWGQETAPFLLSCAAPQLPRQLPDRAPRPQCSPLAI